MPIVAAIVAAVNEVVAGATAASIGLESRHRRYNHKQGRYELCYKGVYVTENQNKLNFCNFALHVVFFLAELTLGHLRYYLTDVKPPKLLA